jgi:hypothetical protein
MNDFSFTVQNKTNEELLNMVYRFDEWSAEMLSAVEAELLSRNLLPKDLFVRKQQMIEAEEAQLIQAKQASPFGQIAGWLTVFGLLGIFMGYYYAFSKTRSKYTNKMYFKYNARSRKNGLYLFYTSICLSAIAILYQLVTASGVNI